MIISLDAEKIFDKFSTPLGEIMATRNIPKSNKSHMQKANSQHQTKWRETHSNPIEISNKTRLSTLSISIQYSS